MIIYSITNLLNGKKYVGQTTRTLEKRFKEHKKNHFSEIGKALNSEGVENFQLEILETCEAIVELNERERFWIKRLNSITPNGYNVMPGGGNFIRNFFRLAKNFCKPVVSRAEPERLKELQKENANLRQLLIVTQSKLIKTQEELNENQKKLLSAEQKSLNAESQAKDSQSEFKLEKTLHNATKQQLEETKNRLEKAESQLEKIKNRGLIDRILNKS